MFALGGTTLLLQICHQLRVGGKWGGDWDFEDQVDVVPTLEGGPASLLKNDINAEQVRRHGNHSAETSSWILRRTEFFLLRHFFQSYAAFDTTPPQKKKNTQTKPR